MEIKVYKSKSIREKDDRISAISVSEKEKIQNIVKKAIGFIKEKHT
jgi:hypothetical protein